MKKLFTFLVGAILTSFVFAQSPYKMSYQAVIRNSGNAIVANTQIGIQISILHTSATGTSVYTETHTPTTNVNGLVSVEIGGGTAVSGNFATIDWSDGPYFIKTETDPAGGSNYTITGTSQILSVPYALHAKTAESVINGFTEIDGSITNEIQALSISNDTIYLGNGGYVKLPGGTNAGDMQYWDGTQWVVIPVGTPGQYLQLSASNIPTWIGASSPTVTTAVISSIANTTATSGGNVLEDGGEPVLARGVCWSISTGPTISDDTTLNGTGIGTFTSKLTGLTPGITYYVRAYAINSEGIAYGNEQSFRIPTVGDAYLGGVLAYILQSGDPGYVAGEFHGLIAATSDFTDTIPWSSGALGATGATGTLIGDGSTNTTNIINALGNTGVYAAKLCRDYAGGGYSDWYLPSIGELMILYTNRAAIGGFVIDNVGYWSSTGQSNDQARGYNFTSHVIIYKSKLRLLRVRPIRIF